MKTFIQVDTSDCMPLAKRSQFTESLGFEMRIRLFLIVLFVGFSCLSGCRARRQSATTSLVQDSTHRSVYWRDNDLCDSCDSQNSSRIVESVAPYVDPPSVGESPAQPKSHSNSLEPVGANHNQGQAKSHLSCNICNQKQSVLVDGNCVACIRKKYGHQGISNLENAANLPQSVLNELNSLRSNGNVPASSPQQVSSQESPLPTQIPVTRNEMPSPAKVDEILSRNKEPSAEKIEKPERAQSVSTSGNSIESSAKSSGHFANDPIAPSLPDSNTITDKLESKINDFVPALDSKASLSSEAKPLVQNAKSSDENSETYPANNQVSEPKAVETPNEKLPEVTGKVEPMPNEIESIDTNQKIERQKPPVKTGISGGVELQPNPKFETFSLEDLFIDERTLFDEQPTNSSQKRQSAEGIEWGPPMKESQQESASETPDANGKPNPIHQPPKNRRQPRVSSRSEEEVYRDLKNATPHNRVIFDNTPLIAEELTSTKRTEFVLRAKPVDYYHEIQRLAKETKNENNKPGEALTQISANRSQVPVLQAKTQISEKQDFEFSSLPVINKVSEQEMGLGTASSITDEVFEPYDFPEANRQKIIRDNDIEVFESTDTPQNWPNDDKIEFFDSDINCETDDSKDCPEDLLASLCPAESSDPVLGSLNAPVDQLDTHEGTVPTFANTVDEAFQLELEQAIFDTNMSYNQWSIEIPEIEVAEQQPTRSAVAVQESEKGDLNSPRNNLNDDVKEPNKKMVATQEVSTGRSTDMVTQLPVFPSKKEPVQVNGDFLLKAVPESHSQRVHSKEIQLQTKSKAQFRFVQPHFQRVVEEK